MVALNSRGEEPLRRREFIGLISSTVAWPVSARAQQTSKPPTIGFFGTGTPSAMHQWVISFSERLSELGWIDGRTVAIEYRWAEGHSERYEDIANEFVRLKVNVIFTTVPTVATLKRTTSVIPIVFALGTDPIGGGLVASLAHPGGNVTGLSMQATDLAGKRVELLNEVVPHLKRLAVLGNVGIPQVVLEIQEVVAAAQKLGIEVTRLEIRQAEDIGPSLETFKGRAEALYVCADPLSVVSRVQINALALSMLLPTMHGTREFVDTGGLMSYGASFSDQFRRGADLVNKILLGTKPGDIPIEQPTKFQLVVNLKTAKALSLELPPSLLASADEVVE
jgi:putative tryptophan/tyrosine transport system substrate-binding protein